MVQEIERGIGESASRRQLVWFLFCRILVISLFLGGTIIYQLRSLEEIPHPALRFLYLLVTVSYLQTIISAVVLPRIHRLKVFAQIQIVWDLLFVAALIYITGSIASPFSFLFILVVISGSVFLSRKDLLLVASAAAILYGSLIDLQFYGYLSGIDRDRLSGGIAERDVFFTLFINVVAFYLTALLSGLLAERLRRSEQAFAKKAIDYEELERLNRTMLENIPSGLMIVNSQGRIRSFNVAATRIIGYSLEQVYDRDVREIFPGFDLYEDGFKEVSRGEGACIDLCKRRLTLGYASTIVDDPFLDKAAVLLVTFQDLTKLKDLEEQLKRSDRLAAVGQLASGLAHEIRNPLASISGSVQLLMEEKGVSKENRRLMGIVVRETERLSGLLTDFLSFARPAPPQPEPTNVSRLLDELCELASGDGRFVGVEICRDYLADVSINLDRQQVYQALWNLVINAAEAMSGEGVLRLGITEDHSIVVEDTGPGISEKLRQKIFDPFFTTKDHGTGLGLASVFAIVEAHGGRIEVSAGRAGGARFTVSLPSLESNGKSLESASARRKV